MTYVFARQGYGRIEYLNTEGEWTRHITEAFCVFGEKSRDVALAEIRRQTSIPVWSFPTK